MTRGYSRFGSSSCLSQWNRRTISSTTPCFVHNLAAKPNFDYKIPDLPDDMLMRRRKKQSGDIWVPPPSLNAPLSNQYGPVDLKIWPREEKEDRMVTAQMLKDASKILALL